MANKFDKESGRTSTIILKHDATNALGIASFIFGLISIFVLAPIFVPMALIFGIIAVVKKQLAWGISGLICALIGFITSPILLGFFGLATLGSLMEKRSQGSMATFQSGSSREGIDMETGSSNAWLDFLSIIPLEHRLTVVIVAAVILLLFVFLFRSQLGSMISPLGGRIREIRLGKLAVTFGDELKEVLDERKHNPGLALESPDLPQGGSKGADAGARDLVLESWGRLKQVVRDVAEARMAQPSALGKLGEAVGLLVGLGMLSTDYAQQIRLLYDLGQKVADSKGKLSMQDAHVYRELVDTLVEWIRRNLINVPPVREQAAPPPPPRRTQVGGYFSSPGSGRVAAILIGVAGPMRGKQFPVDKPVFRIGANPENDLAIQGDDFVSGSHAHLRYTQGALFISDQKSRNGTFLNGNRLKEAALTLHPKDRIRIGDCIFEVL
ncbi:MAG: FHA domain-containing protein, partial [Gammaproteobacteria bacterium]